MSFQSPTALFFCENLSLSCCDVLHISFGTFLVHILTYLNWNLSKQEYITFSLTLNIHFQHSSDIQSNYVMISRRCLCVPR